MYDDSDSDDDYRNARRRTTWQRPSRPAVLVPRPAALAAPAAQPPPGYAMPWERPTTSPLIDRYSGRLKFGVVLDAAAQALAALSSLPSAPPMQGQPRDDMQNMINFHEQLAKHAKRDEQIRTLGALARLFLV